jgi:hypothetical protein
VEVIASQCFRLDGHHGGGLRQRLRPGVWQRWRRKRRWERWRRHGLLNQLGGRRLCRLHAIHHRLE